MRRREFIALLGGTVAWPLAVHGQPAEPRRRIGVLMGLAESDPEGQTRIAALRRGLQERGWSEEQNLHIEYRWAAGNAERTRAYAAELVARGPEVIVVNTPPGLEALRQLTQTIPIVFVQVLDALESGILTNPARPSGNVTGFTNFFEYAMGTKWLDLLMQVAPDTRRVGVLQHVTHPSGDGYLQAITLAASPLKLEIVPLRVNALTELKQGIVVLGSKPHGGLLVLPDTFNTVHRGTTIALAFESRVPAVYPSRFYAADGGLIAYGASIADSLYRAASYVDRILRGASPADLPAQSSTKFELVINLKTAQALGIEIPPSLLARADEVIE